MTKEEARAIISGHIEKELRRIARELLKRHPLRRGPYIISDDDLKQFLGK